MYIAMVTVARLQLQNQISCQNNKAQSRDKAMGLAAQQRHSQQAINIMHGKQQKFLATQHNWWQYSETRNKTLRTHSDIAIKLTEKQQNSHNSARDTYPCRSKVLVFKGVTYTANHFRLGQLPFVLLPCRSACCEICRYRNIYRSLYKAWF